MKSNQALTLLLCVVLTPVAHGANRLLFLEAQGVVGYSSLDDGVIYYSAMQAEVMQKPSVGFDFIQRLTGKGGDVGSIAVQARVAYHEEAGESKAEVQLYNAYIKLKSRFTDYWIGHNRPALGLSSYLDSHGLLLETLAMHGYGYDRDWGAGVVRTTNWGDLALSITTGSGMPVYAKGNYLVSGRISKGVLNQENYTWGWSAAYGEPLETMGYQVSDSQPQEFMVIGTDVSYLWNNLENRVELFAGRKDGEDAGAAFWRFGINLLSEARLKFEVQPIYRKQGSEERYQLSLGISLAATGDLTFRTAYSYDDLTEEQRVVVQWYYYKKL